MSRTSTSPSAVSRHRHARRPPRPRPSAAWIASSWRRLAHGCSQARQLLAGSPSFHALRHPASPVLRGQLLLGPHEQPGRERLRAAGAVEPPRPAATAPPPRRPGGRRARPAARRWPRRGGPAAGMTAAPASAAYRARLARMRTRCSSSSRRVALQVADPALAGASHGARGQHGQGRAGPARSASASSGGCEGQARPGPASSTSGSGRRRAPSWSAARWGWRCSARRVRSSCAGVPVRALVQPVHGLRQPLAEHVGVAHRPEQPAEPPELVQQRAPARSWSSTGRNVRRSLRSRRVATRAWCTPSSPASRRTMGSCRSRRRTDDATASWNAAAVGGRSCPAAGTSGSPGASARGPRARASFGHVVGLTGAGGPQARPRRRRSRCRARPARLPPRSPGSAGRPGLRRSVETTSSVSSAERPVSGIADRGPASAGSAGGPPRPAVHRAARPVTSAVMCVRRRHRAAPPPPSPAVERRDPRSAPAASASSGPPGRPSPVRWRNVMPMRSRRRSSASTKRASSTSSSGSAR